MQGNQKGNSPNRTKDLLLILSGIILGMSTQFLANHIWRFGNIFLNILLYGYTATNQSDLTSYWNMSWTGIAIEMGAIIIVIVLIIFSSAIAVIANSILDGIIISFTFIGNLIKRPFIKKPRNKE